MARVTQPQVAAWGEKTKLAAALATLDAQLLSQLEDEIVSRLAGAGYDTTTWTDDSSTPSLVRTVIAKKYVSWLIDRQYSEDEDLNAYAARLDANAEGLMTGLVDGTIPIPGTPDVGQPSFYPNDTSSAARPTYDDPSLGPAHFSMGTVF